MEVFILKKVHKFRSHSDLKGSGLAKRPALWSNHNARINWELLHERCQTYLFQDHIGRCLKYPVTCPNGCGLSIQRELVSEGDFLVSFRRHRLTVWLTTWCDEFISDTKPYQRWLSSCHDILPLRGDGMRKKGRYVRNCSMRLVIVSVQMSRVAKSTQRTEEKKRMNELKLICMVASRGSSLQRKQILQLVHYNDAILYTRLNAGVFSGKEKFLI